MLPTKGRCDVRSSGRPAISRQPKAPRLWKIGVLRKLCRPLPILPPATSAENRDPFPLRSRNSMSDVNWLAALAAAIAGFALGALWYSPIGFLHLWIRVAQIKKVPTPTPQMFVLLFVLQLVAACGFTLLLGPSPELGFA